MSSGVRVFLVQLPFAATELPIGLAQLAAVVKAAGHACEVFDLNVGLHHRHKTVDRELWRRATPFVWQDEVFIASLLERYRPWLEETFFSKVDAADRPVVGFSCNDISLVASRLVAAEIKRRRPDALVVFGGQYFTQLDRPHLEAFAASMACDAVVLGDGEDTLAELLARRREGRGLDGCAGLMLRGPEGAAVFTPQREPVDLDALPMADYSAFDLAAYHSERLSPDDLLFMASRGCVRHCSFCGFRTGWPGYRRMSAERLYAEIRHQRAAWTARGRVPRRIKFYDLLINGDMANLRRLAKLLAEGEQPVLPWDECNAIIRKEMTESVCRELRAAGARQLIVGIESGSQRVLDVMKKEQTVEDIESCLRGVAAGGLRTRANFMIGHPGETEEDFQASLRLIERLAPYLHEVYPSYDFTYLSGPLAKHPERFGLAGEQHHLFWESLDGENNYLVRVDRYRRMKEFCAARGVRVGEGVNMPTEAFVDLSVARYHEHRGDLGQALERFRRYQAVVGSDEYAAAKIEELQRTLSPQDQHRRG